MKYITFWTNDLSIDHKKRDMIRQELKAGNAVHVDSSCTGHTRAAMVKAQGIEFLTGLGAHEVEPSAEENWLKPFFAL